MLWNFGLTAAVAPLLVAVATGGSFVPVSADAPNPGRDETGTSGTGNDAKRPRPLCFTGAAGAGSAGAERGGFSDHPTAGLSRSGNT